MKRILLTTLFILLAAILAFGQNNSTCPKIVVTDPPVAVALGENMTFTAAIDGDVENKNIFYKWEVNQGKIISGQGTKSITVSTEGLEDTTIEAKVLVSGLEEKCLSTFTGSGLVSNKPHPPRPDEFGNIPDIDVLARTDSAAIELKENPKRNAFIENYGKLEDVVKREKLIAYNLGKHIDMSRVTFARGNLEREIRTRVFIIYENSEEQDCENCELISGKDIRFDATEIEKRLEQSLCPTSIYVAGPPVASAPAGNLTFTAVVESDVEYEDFGYKWSIDQGKIIKGQGTKTITVSTEGLPEAFANATVTITGLPKACRNVSASGSAIPYDPRESELRDEIGEDSESHLRLWLQPYFSELKARPDTTGYIINYGTNRQINEREKMIRDFAKILNLDASRLVIIRGDKEKTIRTRLWIVPVGADPSTVN